MRHASLFSTVAFASILLAPALSQVPASSEPAPPPPPPAIDPAPVVPDTSAGMVKSVNIASLKAVFDRANVPVEVKKEANGFQYLATTLYGNGVFIYPADCKDASSDGECSTVVVESGTWPQALPAEKLVEFSRDLRLSHPIAFQGSTPFLRYVFTVNEGIGPNYIHNALSIFSYDMQAFAKFASAVKAPAQGFSALSASGDVFAARPKVQKTLAGMGEKLVP